MPAQLPQDFSVVPEARTPGLLQFDDADVTAHIGGGDFSPGFFSPMLGTTLDAALTALSDHKQALDLSGVPQYMAHESVASTPDSGWLSAGDSPAGTPAQCVSPHFSPRIAPTTCSSASATVDFAQNAAAPAAAETAPATGKRSGRTRKATVRFVDRSPTPTRKRSSRQSTSKAPTKAALKSKRAAVVAPRQSAVKIQPPASVAVTEVEQRVLELFGHDVLMLDRDAFKHWREKTEMRALSPAEDKAFRRLRRLLLGRTYAQRSRQRQLDIADQTQAECTQLQEENDKIRSQIAEMRRELERRSASGW